MNTSDPNAVRTTQTPVQIDSVVVSPRIPEIQILIRGSHHSGKSRIAVSIARLLEKAVGYPFTVHSGDGDFANLYQRMTGEALQQTETLVDLPLDVLIRRGSLELRPVKITLVDDNTQPKPLELPKHCHPYYVNPKVES